MEHIRFNVPRPKAIDVAYAAGEALANALPIAGPELFRLMFSSPLESRRSKWMEEVSQALQELHSRGCISFEELANNEEFVSFVLQTSKIAVAQHEEEKLKYLRNALLNSVLLDINYDVKCAFINAVDQLSPRHVLFLKLIRDRHSNRGSHITRKEDLIEEAAKLYFESDSDLAGVFFGNLMNLKLIDNKQLSVQFSGKRKLDTYYLPAWGMKFLEFISEPL